VYSPLLRLQTSVVSYVRYLGKAFWPAALTVYYPHPTSLYPLWQWMGAALLLVLLTAAVLVARSRRYLAAGWLWFLVSLLPMIGLVQVGRQSIADRYAYISFIGLFIALTWLIAELFQGCLARIRPGSIRTGWLATPLLAILAVLGVLTVRQIGLWHDSETLWMHTLALTENNYIAQDEFAEFLAGAGRFEEAASHFRAALVIQPDDVPAHFGMGICEHAHGNLKGAIANYTFVLQRSTHPLLRAQAYSNLGSAYRQLGDWTDARECFQKSLQLQPDQVLPIVGLGLVAQRTGELSEAVQQYSRAMSLQPTCPGFLLLTAALESQGRSAEASEIKNRLAQPCPDPAAAQREAEDLLAGKQ
jgi:tetratricopeptide (TPR) repeat protein